MSSTTDKKTKRKWVEPRNQFGGSNWKQNDPNYRDRAQERRDTSDENHSHQHRGLDFAQLAKDRETLQYTNSNTTTITNTTTISNNPQEPKKELKLNSRFAQSIYKTIQYIHTKQIDEKKKHSTTKIDSFLPGRMTYIFDLDPHFSQYLPNTSILSKDDCPPQLETMSCKLDTNILNKFSNIFSPSKSNDNINRANNNNNQFKTIEMTKQTETKIESDDDIFSDAEEYVCESNNSKPVEQKDNEKKKENYFKSSNDKNDQLYPMFSKEQPNKDEVESEEQGPSFPTNNTNDEEQDDEEAYPDTDKYYNNNNDDDDDEEAYPDTDQNYNNNYDDEEAYPDTNQNYKDKSPQYNLSPSQSSDSEPEFELPESLKRKMEDGYSDVYQSFDGFQSKMGEKSKELELLQDSLKNDKSKKKQKKNENGKIQKQLVEIDKILKKKAKDEGSKYYNVLDRNKK